MMKDGDPKIYTRSAKNHWSCAAKALQSAEPGSWVLLFGDNDDAAMADRISDIPEKRVVLTSKYFGAMLHIDWLKEERSGAGVERIRTNYLKTFVDFHLLSRCGLTVASASGFSLSAVAAGLNPRQSAFVVPNSANDVSPRMKGYCVPLPLGH